MLAMLSRLLCTYIPSNGTDSQKILPFASHNLSLKGMSHENLGGYRFVRIKSFFQGLGTPIIKF